MNVFLLLKVKRAILNNPTHFNMGHWDCGTTACIGGWAARLAGLKPSSIDEVKKSLKISDAQSESLFFMGGWPRDLLEKYWHGDPETKTKAAAERIDRFIEENAR